ncbi:MAG TPA: protein translocase subunit SecD [Gaiellaceae bacterium]|nr:protein translocase subunit SecD [Gaiellaceae bacterium]
MRDRRRHLTLLLVILAALGGAIAVAFVKSPTLGLDLRGGLEVVLKAVPPKGHHLTTTELDNSVSIMRSRIDKLGVSEPEIRKQPPDQIVIQLAGVHDPNKAAQIIGQTAQLQIYDLEGDLVPPSVDVNQNPVAHAKRYSLLLAVQGRAKSGTPVEYFLYNKKKVLLSQSDTRAGLFSAKIPKLVKGDTILVVPHGEALVSCGGKNSIPATSGFGCPGSNTSPLQASYYLFKTPAPITGKDLNGSGVSQDFDSTGSPIVHLSFHSHGDSVFQQLTKTLYIRGNLKKAAQHFAVVLDNEIQTDPQIDYTDGTLSNGISGGGEITGIGSVSEAQQIALVLQTGALPVAFQRIEQTDVSASLGKDSLHQAYIAALVAFIIVAIFLVVLYRFLGLVAVFGLGIYAAFLYAAVLLLNVTITLPGFAGLILTIGVAADANVVIFERIKEEVRSGKSVRAAVATGYQKGFHTIIDANVVTVITALVLFAVAIAQVKGFALMLLIGTVISLVTAVAATRAMLGLLAGFRWFAHPRFLGAAHAQHGKFLQIDFMKRRYLWFAMSGAIILFGVISLGVQGLNLGIDFKGGTQIHFVTSKPVTQSQVVAQASKIGRSDCVCQGEGKVYPGGGYKAFQMRMKTISLQDQTTLTKLLQKNLGVTQTPDARVVSSSFSGQIANSAILAIIVSLVLIAAYIALRFDWKYAVPVMVALAHDIAITVGVYSLAQREVSTDTVAAVLTVLGYSIYDTIIIFDRIRENVPIMRRGSFASIANVSLWETIRRSLATTFITLLPIGSLLLFGGATLQDFAFALLIGILSGAYSSIFIAAPLLTIFKEREPEFRRRVGVDVIEKGIGGRLATPVPALATAGVAPEANGPTEEAPEPAVAGTAPPGDGATSRSQQKRERRRQRRSTRPHGRAR